MYAIVRKGSTQVKVQEGEFVDLPYDKEVKENDMIELRPILISGDAGIKLAKTEGTIAGAKVLAQVIGTTFGPRIINFKYKRRHNCRRKVGFRPKFLRVKITQIVA